jgi:hypothetical protein
MSPPVRSDNVVHSMNDIIYIGLGHTRVEWQRQNSVVDRLSLGQITPPIAKAFPVVGVEVNRDEMHTGTNVVRLERFDELSPVNRQAIKHQADRI